MNPNYPLPVDYFTLAPAGQKEARLAAVRKQDTPEDLVWAWSFFRTWYLRQTVPGFFYKRYRESPRFHYQIVRDIGQYPRNAVAAPRASAKSTILAVEVPLLLLLTRPFFNILLVLSKDVTVTKIVKTKIAYQLQNNPLILEDFGRQKPKAGSGPWSDHLMQLASTGATLEASSVKGGLQGPRPDLILIDDPEVDPALQKVSSDLVENYGRLLVDVLMPMLDEGGSSLYWSGTLLQKNCFLYHVVTTKDDERFMYWNRRLLDCEDDGHGNLLWEEKWNWETLEEDKKKLGSAAYNSQRRNRPGTSEEQVLKIHSDFGQYEVLEVDRAWDVNPLGSQATLRGWVRDSEDRPKTIDRPAGEAVQGMFRVMTMDYAKCLSPTSDYVAMVVIGVDRSPLFPNIWWVLDLFVGRISGNTWVRKFWEMALKWRVAYAGIEAVAAQETLLHTAREFVEHSSLVGGWVPRSVPIRYPSGLAKEDRIGGLEWRFASGKIKYPRLLKRTWPWRELYHETEGFTGLPGGTQFDDAIDTVAMAQFLLKGGKRVAETGEAPKDEWDAKARVMAGEPTHKGVQIGLALSPQDLTAEDATSLIQRAYEDAEFESRRSERGRAWIGVA